MFPLRTRNQFRIKPRQLMGIILCFVLLGPVGSDCLAADERKEKKQRIERGMETFRININKLEEGIRLQQEEIASSQEQERSLLDELQQINLRLLQHLDKLRDLEEKVAAQQELIAITEDELQVLEEGRQVVRDHLRKRIKAYYKMGEIGLANVAFSSESMPRMLIFRDSFAELIAYDKSVIDSYRNSITDIQRSKKALQREKSVLDDFFLLAQEEEMALHDLKGEKETLLEQIMTKKELHEMAVKEMERAADRLSASLDSMKKESDLLDQGFLLDKGKHPAPVEGKVTALFGQKRKNKLGITRKSLGLTIFAPGINQVQAIYEGEIIYSSYLQGYGNTIIINHGHQYFSVLSRLERLLKVKGDTVETGDIIGLTGDTATLMDDGIY
ncbi:MAG: peptidoglycan DD-metalloendopeptidase family protein, partial [Thermodesulfobacteriota bacterium]